MSKTRMIKRFSGTVRVTHWIYAVSFIVLAITGFMVYSTELDWMAPVFGGVTGAMVVHRVAGVFLMAAILISLLIRPSEMLAWIKECFTFTKNDAGFMMTFPFKFLGIKKKIPPQGFYNGGEKVNSLIQIISGGVLIVTGLFMWLDPAAPLWMYPLHTAFMVVGTAGAIGHIYLAALNPVSNEAMGAIIRGDVSEKYMVENHEQWYNDVYKAAVKRQVDAAVPNRTKLKN